MPAREGVLQMAEMTKCKHYTFRVDDPFLINLLESIPKKERSKYIREALQMYANLADKLSEMNDKLNTILEKISNISCPQDAPAGQKNENEENKTAKAEEAKKENPIDKALMKSLDFFKI